MNVTIVYKDKAAEVWPIAAPLLAKGVYVYSNQLTLETVRELTFSGEWQLWLIDDGAEFLAALSSRIIQYETNLWRLEICLAGGDEAADWVEPFLDVAESFARTHRCTEVAIIGRKGWERLCRPFGYKHDTTTVCKQIQGLNS